MSEIVSRICSYIADLRERESAQREFMHRVYTPQRFNFDYTTPAYLRKARRISGETS